MKPTRRQTSINWQSIHRNVFVDDTLKMNGFIYHFLPWPHARPILENKKLRLSPIGSWDDPYEKWWCDRIFRLGNLSTANAYGMCWTTNSFAEPSWRIAAFGRSDPIVRIRCNKRALLEAARNSANGTSGDFYFGKIRYCETKRVEELASRNVRVPQDALVQIAATMLLYKRNAFKFENEVRLLWLDEGTPRSEFFMDINLGDTISQVMTSPYAEWKEHMAIKKFVEELGIQSKKSAVMCSPVNWPLPK